MKLELKPGVSPAFFWTTIGIGAASTAASALALTTYAWAGMAGALIALIVGFWQANGPKGPPPGTPLLLALLCLGAMCSCVNDPATKQAVITFGKRAALTAGEAAVVVAQVELSTKTQAWVDAQTAGDPVKAALAAQAMQAAQKALDAAQKALARERVKLDKQPVNVQAAGGQECPRSLAMPACLLASDPSRHAATAANDAQGEPAMPPSPSPAMKQSAGGVSIPLLGEAVAAHLAAAD